MNRQRAAHFRFGRRRQGRCQSGIEAAAELLEKLGVTEAIVLGWSMQRTLLLCSVITIFFASVSGLWGVLVTDSLQFSITMTGISSVMAVVTIPANSKGLARHATKLCAGAAGLHCAAIAGQRGLSVLLIDHAEKVAEKIRISGGGRCNFTNLHTAPERFLSANPHFAKSALSRHSPQDFLALIEAYGIKVAEHADVTGFSIRVATGGPIVRIAGWTESRPATWPAEENDPTSRARRSVACRGAGLSAS